MSAAAIIVSEPPPCDRRRLAADLLQAAAERLGNSIVRAQPTAAAAMIAARNELERLGFIQDNGEIALASKALRGISADNREIALIVIGTALALLRADRHAAQEAQ